MAALISRSAVPPREREVRAVPSPHAPHLHPDAHPHQVFGTYLYGVASAQDGSYMTHRSQRGNTPQWGLGNHLEPHLPDPNDPKEPQSKPAAPWPHALDTRRARLARQAEALSARVARAAQQGRQGQQGQSKRRGKRQGAR